jgi:hypothetical protein
MSPGRVLALLLLAGAALATSALFAARLPHALTITDPPLAHVSPRPQHPERHHHRPARPRSTPPKQAPRPPARRAELGPRVVGLSLPLLIALEAAGGALGLATSALALGVRRARARRRREYARYVLHLSPHDEGKPQDVEDLMEAIAHLVRAFPADRARHGQPYVAFELDHDQGPSGELEWSLAVRCPPPLAVALDGVLSAAYPDARLGRLAGEPPQPTPARAEVQGHVLRFRKQRGFVYPLLPAADELGSPPLEAIAHAQVSLGVPSTIRFTLTPAPASLEAIAHRRFRHHENRLARQGRWGLPEAGLQSTLQRSELTNASRAQNRSLFWLELAVAAADRETCRQLAAAVQARRGENRLHRRWMPIRQNLYRRRFPTATPPLIPSPRALISAAEAAHLLALPTARMKGVPVRRIAIPRIPMPPEIHRAPAELAVPAPPRIEPPREIAA